MEIISWANSFEMQGATAKLEASQLHWHLAVPLSGVVIAPAGVGCCACYFWLLSVHESFKTQHRSSDVRATLCIAVNAQADLPVEDGSPAKAPLFAMTVGLHAITAALPTPCTDPGHIHSILAVSGFQTTWVR